MLDLMNPYVAKILISVKDGDSIRSVSKKIRESYGWTYKWALALEKTGAIERKKQELYINKENYFYKDSYKLVKDLLKNSLSLDDAYLLPNLAGLEYSFTGIDAIFVWTKGGYNIGRSKNAYPIFIEVLEKDRKEWQKYFDRFGIKYSFRNERIKGIYFIISAANKGEKEYCDGIPVLSLADTVEWAKKYTFNFEPALEMLDKLYDLKMGITYAGV